MTDNSARLSLPFLMPSQAQKHVTHNAALERLDVLVQPQVLDLAATTPDEGASYVIGAGACIYDTSLTLPLWSDGTAWRDAVGTVR